MNTNGLRRICLALGTACMLMYVTGCLAVERKSYKITLKGATNGSCVITYHNIVSAKDDGKDISFKDFAELTTDYLEGDKLQDEFPGARNLKSRLYEAGNQLNGEVSFDFDSLPTLKMYQYDAKSPLMMYMSGTNSETFTSGNGTYGGDAMPVVFWANGSRSLTLETSGTEIDTTHVSLAGHYRIWSKGQKK